MKLVGLDLAASGVRGVVLRGRPDSDGLCVIERAAFAPYPSGEPGFRGLELQRIADMSDAVNEVLKKLRVGRTGMVVGYRGKVYVEEVRFPRKAWLKNSHKKQESTLQNKDLTAYEAIGGPELARLSWRVAETLVRTQGEDEVVVEVGAVKREDIVTFENRLRELNIEPRRIDAVHAANIRAVYAAQPGAGTVAAIFDFGAEQTTLTVTLDGQRVLYNQVIESGGNALTQALERHLPEHVDAEAYKRANEFTHTTSQFFNVAGDEAGLDSVVDNFALELVDAYNTYLMESGGREADVVLLMGGGAVLVGLKERVRDGLKLDSVYVVAPRISTKLGKQANAEVERLVKEALDDATKRNYPLTEYLARMRVISSFSTAVGLALAGGEKDVRGDST